MKKLLSVIVLAAMLVTMVCPSFATPADAHDHSAEVKEFDTLTFTVDDVVAERDRKTVDVAVRVAGNGEHNCKTGIWGATVSLYYPGDLQVVDIKNGDLFPESEVTYDLEKWNVAVPDSNTQRALDENKVDVAGKDYKFGRFTAEEKDYAGGTLDNGVFFTVTVELPEEASAGDSWEIGIVANKDDVCDCGTEVTDENGKTVIDYYDIPFSLENGSVSVAYNTEISVGNAVVAMGSEVTVPVTVADNPGMFITRLTATYDADKLEFVGAESGDVTNNSYVITTKVEDGNLTLFFESADNSDITGDGVLLNLTFRAARGEAAVGDTVITLIAEDAVNINGDDINVALKSGTVTIMANTTISVADASVTATYDVEVPVEIVSNTGIWALRAEFAYDDTLLSFKGIKSGIYNAVADENYSVENGVVTVFFEEIDGTASTEDGTLFTLVFTAGRKPGDAAVNVNLIDVINKDSVDLDVKAVGGTVEVLPAPTIAVASVDTYADKTVEVPVNVTGNIGVLSVRMEFAYDASSLKFEGVTSGLFTADETNASAKDGVVTVFVENDTVANMTEDGVLFNLVFTTLKNEDAELTLAATILADSTINADGAEVMFLSENGVITVKAHEHSFETVIIDPTCTEDGAEREVCTICGNVRTETVIPATGHTEGAPVTMAPTCTEDGYSRISCTVCGRLLRESVVKATGHDWVAGETVAPTCVAEGYTEYTCANGCGEAKIDDIFPIDTVNGHRAGDKVVTAEPTYEAAGTYEIRCTLCDRVLESGTIPMLSDVTVSVGNTSARVGKSVTVPVTLGGNPGLFILRLNVSYDADKLVYAGVENGEIFKADNVIFNNVENGELVLYFEASGDADVVANGVLANLKFNVVDDNAVAGDTDVCVEVEEAVNYAGKDVYILSSNGVVSIDLGSTITVNNASAPIMGNVEVPVSIEKNDGVWAVRAEFAYDADMLTFTGIKSGMFETVSGESYSEKDGVITVFVEDVNAVDSAADGVLFTLQFKTGNTVGDTDVTVNVLEVVNADSKDVEVRGINGTVEIEPLPTLAVGTVDGYANTTVKVPVNMNLNPGVFSVRMEIAYDAENLEFVGVSDGVFSADDTNASAKDGVITVFVENDEIADVTGDGVAFYLNFTAKTDADAEYALNATVIADSTVNASSEEVLFLPENGKIVMHAHSEHTVVEEIIEPTCTEDGSKVEKCSVCGEILSEEVIPATGHMYVENKVVEPTCISAGYTLYVCEKCGAEEKRDFTDVIGHNWVVKEVVAPTCIDEGYTVYECSVCGEEKTDDIVPANGVHSWVAIETIDPTCIDEGYTVYECSVCGERKNDDFVPAAGAHNWVAGETVAPTCGKDGYTVYTCSVCGEEKHDDIVPATGNHTPGEQETTVAPTCTAKGEAVIKCTVCGEVLETVELDMIPHNYSGSTPIIEKHPTCTEDGITYVTCNICKQRITLITPAKGHLESEEPVEIPATCEEDGCLAIICEECGEILEVVKTIPAIGHKWKEVERVPSTKTEHGYVKYVCENDETHTRVEELPLLGDYIYGDVNCDGYVDSDDAIWLLHYLSDPDLYPVDLDAQSGCDYNKDGSFDSDDAIYLLYHTLLPERFTLVDPRA